MVDSLVSDGNEARRCTTWSRARVVLLACMAVASAVGVTPIAQEAADRIWGEQVWLVLPAGIGTALAAPILAAVFWKRSARRQQSLAEGADLLSGNPLPLFRLYAALMLAGAGGILISALWIGAASLLVATFGFVCGATLYWSCAIGARLLQGQASPL